MRLIGYLRELPPLSMTLCRLTWAGAVTRTSARGAFETSVAPHENAC
jgi:hypothetical protein